MKIKFLICLLKFSFRPLFITAPSMTAEEMKIEILICGRSTDKLGREIQGATSNKSNSSECRFIINMGQDKQKTIETVNFSTLFQRQVRVLFMGRECFESLPENELHQIYQLHQQVLIIIVYMFAKYFKYSPHSCAKLVCFRT